MSRTIIVGAGIAGAQTALELRHHGYEGEVVLLSEETDEPYDRPPLSKEFLKGHTEREALGLLPSSVAKQRGIDLRLGVRVDAIDPRARVVACSDGEALEYDELVLATGARNRELNVPGSDLDGVWSLRSLEDATGIRAALPTASHVVVIGGGFIGLEVAAAARDAGADVTVVEFLPRVMARVLSPAMSQYFADEHARHGVRILTGTGVTAIAAGEDGRAASVELGDGSSIDGDLIVVGVGVVPEVGIAEQAGLAINDGVVVDAQLRTSDPSIFAIGDCARFSCVVSDMELRLESIQNAADQARFVATLIAREAGSESLDEEVPAYAAIPWFWTEQFESKLQIAGVAPPGAESVVRGDVASGIFSVCRFVGDHLVAVESVNQPRDHLAARKILGASAGRLSRLTRDTAGDATTPLKTLIDA